MPDFPSITPDSNRNVNPIGYNDPFNTVPPGYTKTAAGNIVAVQTAESLMRDVHKQKKILLVLSYWRGDIDRVDLLANLIADLERVHNPDVDILLFGREDCKAQIQYGTVENLKRKFQNVHLITNAGNYARGFPWAANAMWQELVGHMETGRFSNDYRGFLNLEWDCVPTRPGWLNELGREFDHAIQDGYAGIGTFQKKIKPTDPQDHFNGVALYATNINARAKGLRGACPMEGAYDVFFAPKLIPVIMDTLKIHLSYHLPTISPQDLFASPAALFHGVQDLSAMEAVRNEHIDRKEHTFTQKTVFTYRRKLASADNKDLDERLVLWQRGWQSSGWNAVVLGPSVAERHPKHALYMAHVGSLPTFITREASNAKWERFLALAVQGGGVMADFDVVPSTAFRPGSLPEKKGFQNFDEGSALIQVDGPTIEAFIDAVMAFQPDLKAPVPPTPADILKTMPESPAAPILTKLRGESAWREAKAVHFSAAAVKASLPGFTKNRAITEYLRGL